MAAAGYTPVSLYYSTTIGAAPTAPNLVLGELAINVTDGKLYAKDTIGTVYLLADKTTASGNLPGGTAGALVYQVSTGVTGYLALAPAGYFLVSGTTSPLYQNPATLTVGNATQAAQATNLSGGGANRIAYQSATNTTTFAPAPTVNGTVLSWNGSGFSWSVGVPSTTAGSLLGGVAGSVPYQSAPDTTTFATPGTTGQLFTYNAGSSSPSWASATVTLGSTSIVVNDGPTLTLAGLTSIEVTQDPTSELQLATKQYVDNQTTAGIQIHTPVVNDVEDNQSAIYVNGGTTVTVTTIASNTTFTSSAAHGLSQEDQVVPATTANGLVAGNAYYVYSVVSPTQFTLSDTPFGSQLTSFTNGTGLSIALAANSGVGATLTSTGTGPLVSEGYSAILNDRILVLGQTNQAENGVYFVSQAGVASVSPWILTRATDADKYIPKSTQGLASGSYFLVTGGTDSGESYINTNASDIIFGTTAITFAQFGAGGSGSGGVSVGQVYFMANN